jgi:hypothetical protein
MEEQYYSVWFDLGVNKNKIKLPVNPSEISVVYDGDNTNYNLIGLGETVIPRTPKLATVKISSFFPAANRFIAGTTSNAIQDGTINSVRFEPITYVNFFHKLQTSKTVFQLIINRFDVDTPMFDTTFEAVISSFVITDKGGESGDVYFDLDIQEYRNTAPKLVDVVKIDEDNDTTYLTTTKQRSVDSDEFVVGDLVVVSGPVYETDDQSAILYSTSRQILTRTRGVIGRILPPNKAPEFDRVYITGIGWVQKTDCIKSNINNNINKLQPEK